MPSADSQSKEISFDDTNKNNLPILDLNILDNKNDLNKFMDEILKNFSDQSTKEDININNQVAVKLHLKIANNKTNLIPGFGIPIEDQDFVFIQMGQNVFQFGIRNGEDEKIAENIIYSFKFTK
jgi:hypothetical protein